MTRSGKIALKKGLTTPGQIQLLQWIGEGRNISQLEREMGLAHRTLSGRMKRIRRNSGKVKLSAVMYWALTEMHVHFPKRNLPPPRDIYVPVVEMLADDKTHGQIARALKITVLGVEDRVRRARAEVAARNEAHLVTIYWCEDWIS